MARLFVLSGLVLVSLGCGSESDVRPESLVDRLAEARLEAPEGRYASFATREDGGLVETPDGARRALTPPFPGKLSFEVTVPESGRLTFYPTLVTRQRVRRALVDFVVSVDDTMVFTETLDFEDANQWRVRTVDLSAYSGRDVTLAFETRTFRGGADKLWADRIQTAWGEPTLSRRETSLDTDLAGSVRELEAWLASEAPSMRFDAAAIVAFAVNLLIGGGLALLIRALYLRLGSSSAGAEGRRAFSSLFPLFTLCTVLLITVVELSVALSLGLLGALSVVRFRSSIKAPEEITYLLFCVGVGLSLGAGARGVAVAAVVLVSLFELVRHRLGAGSAGESAFVLTLSGNAREFFAEDAVSTLERLSGIVPNLRFHRLDRDGQRIELSAVVRVDGGRSRELSRALAEGFPRLEISCVDADALG